jgi:hypothetical protein
MATTLPPSQALFVRGKSSKFYTKARTFEPITAGRDRSEVTEASVSADVYNKVLLNYGLLEAILLQADSFLILAATRVCTAWRSIVENSKPLRQYLPTLQLIGSIRVPVDEHEALERIRHSKSYKVPEVTYGRLARADIWIRIVKLNNKASGIWNFRARTNNGHFFAFQIGEEEIYVFAANSRHHPHLIILGGRYRCRASYRRSPITVSGTST